MSTVAQVKAFLAQAEAAVDALPPSISPAMPSAQNCVGGTVPVATWFGPWDYWTTRNIYHQRMQCDVLPGSIACIGSSVTEAMNVSRIHPACMNWGLGGDTMRGVLNRIAGLTHLSTAGAVVVELCTNDMGVEPMPNVELMLDRLFGWLTGPLVVLSPIPHRGSASNPVSIAGMDATFEKLQERCAGRPDCVFVDVTNPLRHTDGYMKLEYSIGDYLHPNAAGYAVMRPLIQAGLEAVL